MWQTDSHWATTWNNKTDSALIVVVDNRCIGPLCYSQRKNAVMQLDLLRWFNMCSFLAVLIIQQYYADTTRIIHRALLLIMHIHDSNVVYITEVKFPGYDEKTLSRKTARQSIPLTLLSSHLAPLGTTPGDWRCVPTSIRTELHPNDEMLATAVDKTSELKLTNAPVGQHINWPHMTSLQHRNRYRLDAIFKLYMTWKYSSFLLR